VELRQLPFPRALIHAHRRLLGPVHKYHSHRNARPRSHKTPSCRPLCSCCRNTTLYYVTMAVGLGETITVINKSGKVVSSVSCPIR
jgi:hypothetical protein